MPTTSESRLIAAPRADVWAAITDLEAAARWNQVWQRVEYLSSQREGADTTFRAYTEDDLTHDFRISEWEPPQHVAFAPLQYEPGEKRYLITLESQSFLLEPVGDDHTNVTLSATAAGHGLRGWLVTTFFWPGYQRHGLARALDALAELFEPPEEDDEEVEEEEEEEA
jgi:uncharacterized protein YndB with AHSA1/START domain